MKYSIGIEKGTIHFSSAHFIVTENFYEPLHGHNYHVKVELFGNPEKDDLIINFLDLESICKKITEKWDHFTLIPAKNPNVEVNKKNNVISFQYKKKLYEIPEREVVMLDCVNVSAEYLCSMFLENLKQKLTEIFPNSNLKKLIVTLWEGPKYFAKVISSMED